MAVAKAAVAAGLKPQQPAAQLKSSYAELYPVKLDEVPRTNVWTEKTYGKQKDQIWTVDKSKELRPCHRLLEPVLVCTYAE